MKTHLRHKKIQSLKAHFISFLASIIFLLFLPTGHAQSTIAYFAGPTVNFDGWEENGDSLDLDLDGTPDFNFANGPWLTTGLNDAYGPYSITSLGTNAFLCTNRQIAVLSLGTLIGANSSTNYSWSNLQNATLDTYSFVGQLPYPILKGLGTPTPPTRAWSGPATPSSGAFFGVSFYAADGLHYGWLHALLPNPVIVTNASVSLDGPPTILEWAYETRTNTPILAGAKPIPALMSAPQIATPGMLRIAWQSQSNVLYQIQYKDSLITPQWTNFGSPISAASFNTTTNVPIGGASRFFRVVQAE